MATDNAWSEISDTLTKMLRLKSEPISFRRLEKVADLEKISNVVRIERGFSFCQVPFLVRVIRQTIGIVKDDPMIGRCARLHGLKKATDKSMQGEAATLATTWWASPEDGLKQQMETPRIPVAEAVVLAPLAENKFEPEVISIYANPAQVMMILCGLQKIKYERFPFFFIGEGACADSLVQCYVTGKPAVSIPCYGERMMGQVGDDEMVISLPPAEIDRAISGMKKLAKIGFTYPVTFIGGMLDPNPILAKFYPPQDGKQ